MKVIAWDTRLDGVPMPISSDRANIIVNGSMPLQTFVTKFLILHSRFGNFAKMRIKCHGLEQDVVDERRGGTRVIGGFGLQFCQEGITLESVALLAPLNGKVSLITIPSCRAAHTSHGVTADGTVLHGDGMEIMRRMARITGARVMASPHLQVSDMVDGERHAGEWSGTVYTFNPDGTLAPIRSEDTHPLAAD